MVLRRHNLNVGRVRVLCVNFIVNRNVIDLHIAHRLI